MRIVGRYFLVRRSDFERYAGRNYPMGFREWCAAVGGRITNNDTCVVLLDRKLLRSLA